MANATMVGMLFFSATTKANRALRDYLSVECKYKVAVPVDDV